MKEARTNKSKSAQCTYRALARARGGRGGRQGTRGTTPSSELRRGFLLLLLLGGAENFQTKYVSMFLQASS